MAAGDAQRVWFPEMLEELAAWWKPDVTWEALGEFCGRMMEMRKAIREARGIEAPLMYCRECNKMETMDIPGITMRSALFALKKAGVLSDDQLQERDRSWKRHQRKNGLDGYGKKKEKHNNRLQTDGHTSRANQAGSGDSTGSSEPK